MTKKQRIPINVNKTKEWCVVTKNNKIIEKFRLLTTAHQMISFIEKRCYQKLYIKRLGDLE